MKQIQTLLLGFLTAILLASDAHAGRWLARDPIEFMERDPRPGDVNFQEQLNLYRFVDNNPLNFVDPLGLWGIAFGNNSGSHYINFGWGNPSYYYSPSVYAPSKINGPVSGLAIYVLGEGDPVTIGPNLEAQLKQLQKDKPWSQTDAKCATSPKNLSPTEYFVWYDVQADFEAYASLGNFRYNNDGTTTSVSDHYAFPWSQSNWQGSSNHRNAIYSWIPGTPYDVSGSWSTPSP